MQNKGFLINDSLVGSFPVSLKTLHGAIFIGYVQRLSSFFRYRLSIFGRVACVTEMCIDLWPSGCDAVVCHEFSVCILPSIWYSLPSFCVATNFLHFATRVLSTASHARSRIRKNWVFYQSATLFSLSLFTFMSLRTSFPNWSDCHLSVDVGGLCRSSLVSLSSFIWLCSYCSLLRKLFSIHFSCFYQRSPWRANFKWQATVPL